MQVTLTEQLDVKPIKIEFEVWMKFDRKKGVEKDYWFTPSGKCYLWVGGLYLNHLGELGKGQYDRLMEMMKDAKCDVLTDGTTYYTTGSNNLIRLDNVHSILHEAKKEYQARF